MRVLVTRRWPSCVEERLQRMDASVVLNDNDGALDRAELQQALQEFDIIAATVTDQLDQQVLRATPLRTRMIANYGVGVSHIDLRVAKSLGITVTNTPGVLTNATADLTMALVLAVARRTGEGERELRAGRWTGWRPTHLPGRDVTGAKLGIVGLGRIGRAVATRAAKGFSMQIGYFHPREVPENELGVVAKRFEALGKLAAWAEFLSIHCPGGDRNYHLIDADILGQMQTESVLINTSRGEVVDERALVIALQQGQIGGAGLDVYEKEPQVSGRLLAAPNLTLLPHLGSATKRTRVAMGMRAVKNMEAWIAGGIPSDIVSA